MENSGKGVLRTVYYRKVQPLKDQQFLVAQPLPPSRPPEAVKPKPKVTHQALPSTRYNELLRVIEELGKDVKPTYAGSKNAAERLRKGILHARALVRDCLLETERNARK